MTRPDDATMKRTSAGKIMHTKSSITSASSHAINRKPKIGILTVEDPNSTSFNLRLKYPLTLLSNVITTTYIARITAERVLELHPERIEECDAFIIQRAFPSTETQSLIAKVIESGEPIIYESDDLLEEIPPSNPEYGYHAPRAPYIKGLIKKASLLTLNTHALQGYHLDQGSPPSFCLKNHLPISIWNEAGSGKSERSSAPIVIGFAGNACSARDLEIIEEPLLRIARIYEDRVNIIVWGLEASEGLRTLGNFINIKQGTPYPLYAQKLARLGIDIGLAPLEDTPFNLFKSDLKWLEFSALGIATIVSDTPVYAEAIDNGLALAAPNTPDDWFNALVRLIEDKDLCKSLGMRARSYVQKSRSLEAHAREYAEIINQVLPAETQIPTGESLPLSAVPPTHPDEVAINADSYDSWLERTTIQETDAEVLAERMMAWPAHPTVSLISIAQREELPLITETIAALQDQLYENWQFLVISDGACPDSAFDRGDFLGWIQVDTLDDANGLAVLLNQVLRQNGGDFFALLPAGTRLQAHALLLMLDHFFSTKQTSAVYTDHDYYGHEGRLRPQFKPTFDLEWLRSSDYIAQSVFFNTADVLELGGVRPFQHSMHYDLLLRIAEHAELSITHVARPLLSFPLTESADASVLTIARQVALEQHLVRCGNSLTAHPGAVDGSFRLEPVATSLPSVSIIVACKDVFHLAEACLDSLFEHTDYPDYELVVVDNQSTDPDIHHLYSMLRQAGRRLKIVAGGSAYELAPAFNRGAAAASGEVLVFILADCVFRDPSWLTRLVTQVQRDDIGVVGPLVLQPELGQIESAGLFLGGRRTPFSTSRPGLRGLAIDDNGYMCMLRTPRTVSAVSAVGFTVRRERFEALGSFDERFANSQFEVDFCLRAAEHGWKTLYTPYARIVHHRDSLLAYLLGSESARITRMQQVESEQVALLQRWGRSIGDDPRVSPHFAMSDSGLALEGEFPLAWPTSHHQRARVLGFPVVGGSGEYRLKMPFKALVEAGWLYAEAASPKQARLPSAAEVLRLAPDCVLLHQKLGHAVTEMVDAWKTVLPDLRIVFGLDDRMDAVPFKSNLYLMHKRGNPDARNKLRRIIERSDTIIVSTEPLAALVRELAGDVDVRVIPNSLVRGTWAHLQPKRRLEGKPRVGWVGAHQHRGDLELIISVLEATHKQVDWIFMGMWLPEFQGLVKEKHPGVSFEDYPAAIAALDLDLAIAPLELNPFNEAKSNLRLLEYGILGYPVICTDIHPYQTANPPVLRLPNVPKQWIESILDKVTARGELQREGAVLRDWVLRHYMLEQHLPAWNEALLTS